MIDIEQQAINMFQNNLTYLKERHPQVHRKLEVLQNAIQSGQYRENYSLEYIDGYFDVMALSSGTLLYGSSSLKHASEAAQSVTLDKEVSVIKTYYDLPYTKANVEDLDHLSIINSWMVGTAPIVRFVNEQLSGHDRLKRIYKFIFFGVGIGAHLSTIHQRIDADSYLIIEDDLELFRLSMFVTDYQRLAQNARLYLSVMDTPGEFKTIYRLFAEDLLIRNSILKFYLLADSYAPKIKQIQNFAVTRPHLAYPYNHLLYKNLKVSQAIHEGYHFLDISRPFETSLFAEKPILYLAAGPSLDAQIDWVKANQDAFIIVCVFMITVKLERAGVRPDIVVHVDEAKEAVENTLSKMHDPAFLKESLFILAASAPLESLASVTDKEHLFLIEDRTHYKRDHGSIEFFSVGEVGYALSLLFGARKVYLLGLDLAVDQQSGKTHADGHNTLDEIDISKGDTGPEASGSLRKTLMAVKGNRRDICYTTPLFDASIHRIDYFTKRYRRPEQTVLNLGDGAYFEGTLTSQTEDVHHEAMDKGEVVASLSAYFRSRSSDSLSDEERNDIVLRKKEVKKKARLIERFASAKIKDLEAFRKQFIALIGALITPAKQETNEVSEVFLTYFQTVGDYIGNLLNTEGVDQSSRRAKTLQKILARQLYKILHDIGSFKFGYINAKRYFDTERYGRLQYEILDPVLKGDGRPRLEQWMALYAIKEEMIDPNRLGTLCKRGHIGLLAFDQDIQDQAYMGYVMELYAKTEARFTFFVFNDVQEAEVRALFHGREDRLVFVRPRSLYDIVGNMEVFVYKLMDVDDEDFSYVHHVVSNILRYCENIFPVTFSEPLLDETLEEASRRMQDSKIMRHHRELGFTDEEVAHKQFSYHMALYQKALDYRQDDHHVISLVSPKRHDLTHIQAVQWALHYPHFIHFFYQFRRSVSAIDG